MKYHNKIENHENLSLSRREGLGAMIVGSSGLIIGSLLESTAQAQSVASVISKSGNITYYHTIQSLKEADITTSERVIFVNNHSSEKDQGGGLFCWDSNSEQQPDDGIYILPDGSNASAPGRWVRLRTEEHLWSVKWYGAFGDGRHADDRAIQATFDAAWRAGGGRVYFPSGEYRVISTLILRRSSKINTNTKFHPMRLTGDGPTLSVISGRRLAQIDPVIDIRQNKSAGIIEEAGAENFAFENMSIGRNDDGIVLQHLSIGDGQKTRLRRAVFRNLEINARSTESSYAALNIEHGHELNFDNVSVRGSIGVRFKDCSRVSANRLHTRQDRDTGIFVKIIGGGDFVFNSLRSEATTNKSVLLQGSTKRITFIDATFECKGDRKQIHIKDANLVTLINCAIGSPDNNYGYRQIGLQIDSKVHTVRVQGLRIGKWKYVQQGSVPILIRAGARNIRVLDVNPFFWDRKDYGKLALVENRNSIGRDDVIVEAINQSDFFSRRQWTRSTVRPVDRFNFNTSNNELNVGEGEVFLIADKIINRLSGGHNGKCIKFIFSGKSRIEATKNIYLLKGESFSGGENDVIDLICKIRSGIEKWQEISRSVNSQ